MCERVNRTGIDPFLPCPPPLVRKNMKKLNPSTVGWPLVSSSYIESTDRDIV